MNLTAIMKTVLSLSFMGSILALLIILAKALFRTKLSATAHYYIWFLLIIRLLIPFAPESPLSIFNLVPGAPQNSEISPKYGESIAVSLNSMNSHTKNEVVINSSKQQEPHERESNTVQGKDTIFNVGTLSIIWACGSGLMLIYMFVINMGIQRKIRKQPQCREEDILTNFRECKLKMKVRRDIPIMYYDNIKTPSLLGILRPKLLILTEILNKLSEEEMRYVFLHELSHLKRKDILVNWIMLVAQAMHWFNPIVWYAFHKIHEDCESACDAHVLSRLKPVEYKKYGETIINLINIVSKPHWNLAAAGIVNNNSGIKRRVRMITLFKKNSWKWSVMTVVLLLALGVTCMTDGLNSILKADKSPRVNIVAEIRNLTREEFSEVGTAGLENPSISDFRKFTLDAEILYAGDVSSKVLKIPGPNEINVTLDKIGDRFWFGSSSDQNNNKEDFARSERSMVIYFRDLSEDEFRRVMQPLKIQIGWTTKKGSKVEKEYSLGEILTFKK